MAAPEPKKLDQFVGKVIEDMSAAITAALVFTGDQLGLYRAMGDGAPVSSAELAKKTGTAERYVREWLNNQAAAGYVQYDPSSGSYSLSPEQSAALAQDD